METPPDWDLLAVVRSCSSTTTTTTATTTVTATVSPSNDIVLSPPPTQQPTTLPQNDHLCFSPIPSTTSSSNSTLFGFSTPLPTTSFLSQGQGHQEKQDIYNNNNISSSFQSLSSSSMNSPISSWSSSIITSQQQQQQQQLRGVVKPSQGHQEHQDIYTNNNNNNNNNNINININSSCSFQSPSSSSMNSPISSWTSSIITSQQQQQQQLRGVVKPSQVIFGTSSPTVTTTATTTTTTTSGATSQNHKTRKRKSLMKKVCHIPAEGLSSDMWAWRKYGQKPIKGSPHPRGYYRCSSSKGCLARKQVERNRSNPKMLIVTYTSEHNHPIPTHRNSLAGSTRHKPVTTTCSDPTTASLEKPKTEGETLVKDEEDNDIGGLCDLILNDDFYVGFEKIDGGSDDSDCFSEQFSPSSEFTWLGNDGGGTTTTAGGES
ncbi:hypothetical protein KSS87_006737 [Heliosperma pusillum]|nr:hypothetical protein KSS87_006737 [Heliosperma pusillum]